MPRSFWEVGVEHEVVIAGGGPTGLVLAGELALAGVDVAIVERRADQSVDGSRAGGLTSRTLEVLDQRGIAERFVAAGKMHPVQPFSLITLDAADPPTRYPGVLALWQGHVERILAGWVEELGVPVLRSREVVGFTQDGDGVRVDLSDGTTASAAYLVGCDGGRSLIRKAAGIVFPGSDPSTSWLIAEVAMDEEPSLGFRHDSVGTHAIGRREPGEPVRVVLTERRLEQADDPSIDELRQALTSVYGTDFGLREAAWISRFTDMARQAASYRSGRVLLAGDAAHVHPPHGGQGLNIGVQDAMNLGWKLAQVVNGTSPDDLLDTYQAERHPVGARTLRTALAQVALRSPDDRHQALRDMVGDLLTMDEPRRYLVGMLSGLDVRYDLGDGHPLIGQRMPDLDLQTASGSVRALAFLHEARPVLLNLGPPRSLAEGRVRLVEASSSGIWELPVVGAVAAPPAVLIRPDGYVAWAGPLDDPGLAAALATWSWG